MRKLFAIFIVSAVILYSILLCYADEQTAIQKDLPLASKYETNLAQQQLSTFETQATAILAEQLLNINVLSELHYMGYVINGSFDGASLERSMSRKVIFPLNAPIYKSQIFKDYYRLRTEKLLKQYSISQIFVYGTFTKTARLEFDNYMKAAVKGEAERKSLVIMLQEKLMDKLIDLEPNSRKAMLEEIYSLRLPENTNLCQDYLYQVFEHGVRIEILNQMLDANKEKLAKLTHDAAIRISSERSGKLLLQYKTALGNIEALQILNVVNDEQGYNGLTILSELYGKKDSSLVFTDSTGNEHLIGLDRALSTISLDDKGYLQLKLDGLLDQGQADIIISNQPETIENIEVKQNEEQIKNLEALYNSKAIEAQGIIKELNRYSMYLELKNKGVSNYFTRRFEADKKPWKAALEGRLNKFGTGGMADFASYLKQFVLASRNELGQSDGERVLVARFRNSVVQFRQPDDSSLWMTDMLYNFKYMK